VQIDISSEQKGVSSRAGTALSMALHSLAGALLLEALTQPFRTRAERVTIWTTAAGAVRRREYLTGVGQI
jgi:hypothetical protein